MSEQIRGRDAHLLADQAGAPDELDEGLKAVVEAVEHAVLCATAPIRYAIQLAVRVLDRSRVGTVAMPRVQIVEDRVAAVDRHPEDRAVAVLAAPDRRAINVAVGARDQPGECLVA